MPQNVDVVFSNAILFGDSPQAEKKRMDITYFRRWRFWNSVSLGLINREGPSPVTYLCGVPRYLYGQAARGMLRATREMLGKDKDPWQVFSDELRVWDMARFFYGKHFYRPAR